MVGVVRSITVSIGLHQVDIIKTCTVGSSIAAGNISAISGLLNGSSRIQIFPAVGACPDGIAVGVSLYQVEVITTCTEGLSTADDNITAVSGLLDEFTFINFASTIGARPEGIAVGIGLHQVDIVATSTIGGGKADNNKPAVSGLLNAISLIILTAPIGACPEGITRLLGVEKAGNYEKQKSNDNHHA